MNVCCYVCGWRRVYVSQAFALFMHTRGIPYGVCDVCGKDAAERLRRRLSLARMSRIAKEAGDY